MDSIQTFTKLVEDGDNFDIPIINCKHDRILFKDNISGKYGFLNKKGDIVIKPQFEDAKGFYDGLAPVKSGGNFDDKWGYIDINGNYVIDEKFSFAGLFSDGYAISSIIEFSKMDEDGGFGISINPFIINRKGYIVGEPLNPAYTPMSMFEEGVTIMKGQFMGIDLGTYKYLDTLGNIYPDFELNEIKEYSNGYSPLKTQENKWVFVNKDLIIVSEEYEDARIFSDGYAAVKKNNKWGYVDTSFKVKIPFRYDDCRSFHNGLAKFKMKNMASIIEGYINKQGDVVWQKETTKWE